MTENAAMPEREEHQFQAEIKQVLNILIHSLYTHREIFLRELVSNASDALSRYQFEALTNDNVRDPDLELKITIEADEENRILRISDTGIGLTHDDMIKNLGTVAQSGAKAFIERMQEGQSAGSSDIIGQFGVGFYSVFMVADEVRVTSLSYDPDATAWHWISQGESSYTLEPADRTERGTTIEIQLKEDASEFAQRWKIEQIVRQHSNYVAFPVYMGEGEEQKTLNERTALWRKQPREVEAAEYNDFYRQMTMEFEAPLRHFHLSTDAPVDLHAILYLPAKREQGFMRQVPEPGVRLYSRKILIQDLNDELLPKHLRFVQGVVDSEDLPLNVSRETVQSSPVLRQISRTLTGRISKEIEKLANEEPETFAKFWKEFGPYFKEGLVTEPGDRAQIVPLLRFNSTHGDDLVKLSDYVERMPEGQDVIYYVIADSLQSAKNSPHLDYFTEQGTEVLLMHEPIDSFMVSSLHDFEGKQLKNAATSAPEEDTSDLHGEGALSAANFGQLADRITEVLSSEKVSAVRASGRLRNSPARLVAPEGEMNSDMDRVRRMMGQDYSIPTRILELNPRHSIVKNLATMLDEADQTDLLQSSIQQLYGTVLLGEGLHPNPSELAANMYSLLEAATKTK